jgi:hypothetical protein
MKIPVYLALQTRSDGELMIRRYSTCAILKNRFEKRSIKARDWLEKYANPKWDGVFTTPNLLDVRANKVIDFEPYEFVEKSDCEDNTSENRYLKLTDDNRDYFVSFLKRIFCEFVALDLVSDYSVSFFKSIDSDSMIDAEIGFVVGIENGRVVYEAP